MGRSFPTVEAPTAAQTLMEVLAEAPTIPPALRSVSMSWLLFLGIVALAFAVWLIELWLSRPYQLQDQDFHLDLEPRGATVAQIDPPTRPKNPTTSLPAVVDYEPPSGNPPETCTVCTEDVAAGEKVRRMPRCSHVFHRDCIDPWFALSPTCPLCRSDVEAS